MKLSMLECSPRLVSLAAAAWFAELCQYLVQLFVPSTVVIAVPKAQSNAKSVSGPSDVVIVIVWTLLFLFKNRFRDS